MHTHRWGCILAGEYIIFTSVIRWGYILANRNSVSMHTLCYYDSVSMHIQIISTKYLKTHGWGLLHNCITAHYITWSKEKTLHYTKIKVWLLCVVWCLAGTSASVIFRYMWRTAFLGKMPPTRLVPAMVKGGTPGPSVDVLGFGVRSPDRIVLVSFGKVRWKSWIISQIFSLYETWDWDSMIFL